MKSLRDWYKKGEPWVWLNAGAVAINIVMVVGLLGLIAVRGLGHFWPHAVVDGVYTQPDGSELRIVGEVADEEWVPASRLRESGAEVAADQEVVQRILVKTGNRDLTGQDFRWLIADNLRDVTEPEAVMVIERREWGNYYGFLKQVKEQGQVVASGDEALAELNARLERALQLHDQISDIESGAIGAINYQLEQLRLHERGLTLQGALNDDAKRELAESRAELDARYQELHTQLNDLYTQIKRDSLVAESMSGQESEIPLERVVHFYQPNALSLPQKIAFYGHQFWGFLTDEPREANTEGGVFPAIFGTVLMVLLMSIIVTPFGVVAAVYLREYAKQGAMTRIIRIAVNNLAGVPSIVYGVFGLGFFVYFLGGSLDD
ncbi:MAG TPA: phosphate ABC transporter, permease protein PstA, partial [Dongiaceae bacterium]|nr:phosphate ABC transporter, permease protein PstA [Dongiaceae bacterium]